MANQEANNYFRKTLGAVIVALLVAFLTWQASTTNEICKRLARLEIRIAQVENATGINSKWIRDWYNELRVPERDQKQDDAIKGLRSMTSGFDTRLRLLETNFAGLGGPKDPLFGTCKALEERIRALEKTVK